MKYFVVCFSLCVAIVASTDSNVKTGSIVSLARENHGIQARGVDDKKKASSKLLASQSPRPLRSSSPAIQTSGNERTRKHRSPNSEPEEGGPSSSGPVQKSPKRSLEGSPKRPQGGSRPPSRQENTSPGREARESRQQSSQPGDNRSPLAMGPGIPSPPRRIRTNPHHTRTNTGHQAQREQPAQVPSSAAASQAQPARLGNLISARMQQIQLDPALARAGAEIRNGQGSVMTSHQGEHGPANLGVDHLVGSHARFVASPYHTSVMATNNLPSGETSARAAGNHYVKGSIESLDPRGRGVLKVQVPGQSEVKTTIQGVGRIESEAVNYRPSAGHARVQADLRGYGWAEAQGSQDRLRPDTLAAFRVMQQQAAQNPNPNPYAPPGNLQQQDARASQGMRRNSGGLSGPDSAEQVERPPRSKSA